MKCPICKHGETQPGLTTVTLERDGMAVVFRGVHGGVCDNYNEFAAPTPTGGSLGSLARLAWFLP